MSDRPLYFGWWMVWRINYHSNPGQAWYCDGRGWVRR